MFSQISFAAMSFAMAVVFGMAIANDAPAITAELNPWLDQVEILRTEAHDLTYLWEHAARLPRAETGEFAESVTGFIALTDATSSRIRELESGNDAACILHGISLDVNARLEALTENTFDPVTAIEVLNGIERLLFEGLLIFGREQEANLYPSDLGATPGLIRISTGAKDEFSNPHPYVEVDCDGNPISAK